MRRNSSSEVSQKNANDPTNATFTQASTGPSSDSTRAAAASTAPASATSVGTARHRRPAASTSATAPFSPAAPRASTATS